MIADVVLKGLTTPKPKACLCCEEPVRLQCETDYCGSRCRQGKCGHRG